MYENFLCSPVCFQITGKYKHRIYLFWCGMKMVTHCITLFIMCLAKLCGNRDMWYQYQYDIKPFIQTTFFLALVVRIQGGIRYGVKEITIYKRKTYKQPLILKYLSPMVDVYTQFYESLNKNISFIKEMVTKMDFKAGFVRLAHGRKRKEHKQRHNDKNSMTWTGIIQYKGVWRLSKKEELMAGDARDVKLTSFGTLNAMLRILDLSRQGLQILKEK